MIVGIIGCGSIGKRHVKNIKDRTQHRLVLFDSDPAISSALHYEIEGFILSSCSPRVSHVDFLDDLLNRVDCVIICTPHSTHADYALAAAKAGKHVFVEKPAVVSLEQLEMLEQALKNSFIHFETGFNLRYHPVVLRTQHDLPQIGRILSARFEYGSYLPAWRPGTDHTKNYAASPVDGGIIMDDIHELDLVCRLIGHSFDRLSCVSCNIGNLGLKLEDSADISMIVRTQGMEIPVSVHMDYLQRVPVRKFRIVGENGTIDADLNSVSMVTETRDFRTLHKFDNFVPNDMYVSELEHFFLQCQSSYAGGASSNLLESSYSLRMALASKESAETGRTIQ